MYAMERSEMYAAIIYHAHIYLSKGKYYLNLSDTFTFLTIKVLKNHPDLIETNISLVNVGLISQYLM